MASPVSAAGQRPTGSRPSKGLLADPPDALPPLTLPRAAGLEARETFALAGSTRVEAPDSPRTGTLAAPQSPEQPADPSSLILHLPPQPRFPPLSRHDLPRDATPLQIARFIQKFPTRLVDAQAVLMTRQVSMHIYMQTHPDPVVQLQGRLELFERLDEALSRRPQTGEVADARAEIADAIVTQKLLAESAGRTARLMTPINGHAHDVAPPCRTPVTLAHVEAALGVMLAGAPAELAARFKGLDLAPPSGLFEIFDHSEYGDDEHLDTRFGPGIELTAAGRELLGAYYGRKYQADIVFHALDGMTVSSLIPRFVERARQVAGDVRQAHYLGHAMAHGTLFVYVREGADEALLYLDSSAQANQLDVARELAITCEPLARNGRKIQVFQHTHSLQKDLNSCWLFAMKTAVTLTGKRRHADGPGDYLVPGAIGRLALRRMQTDLPEGVQAVWALPEIARMSQSRKDLMAHAGSELGVALSSMKPGETLRSSVERFTYQEQNGHQHLDYIRQKGERLAEVLEIESWSREIGRAVPAGAWGFKEQTEFAEQMKRLVRRPPGGAVAP